MASGGTVVVYGPMTFFNVLTRYINQEIQYDSSGSDALCFKFNCGFTVFISGLAQPRMGVIPTLGNGDAGATEEQILFMFGPRQHFEYRVGVTVDNFGNIVSPGSALILSDPANILGNTNVSLRDVNNGPKAKVVNIARIASDALIKVDVEFEVWQTICAADGSTGNNSGVLNNRWSVVDDIDRNFITTRTFTGLLRCSSAQVNANNFRNLVVPPLQQGMRREHMNFAVSEDGLNLLYSVTDKEVAFAPPKPATSWSARFSERKAYDGQLGVFYDAEITLAGDRSVDKQKLIAIAASMALAKFSNGVRLANDNSYRVLAIDVIDEYGDDASAIHLRATAQRVDSVEEALMGLASSFMGKPLDGKIEDVVAGYDSRFSRGTRPGESIEVNGPISLVGAFAAYLQGPCQINFAIANGIQGQVGDPPGVVEMPTVSAVVNNGITDDTTISANYNTDNQEGAYTFHHAETHDETDANTVQMPVAVTGTGSDQPSLGDAYFDGTDQPAKTSAAIVTLAPPTTVRHHIVASERTGKPPNIPKPKAYTDGGGVHWSPGSFVQKWRPARKSADGKKIFNMETQIIFYAKQTVNIAASLVGFNPWAKVVQEPIPRPDRIDPQ